MTSRTKIKQQIKNKVINCSFELSLVLYSDPEENDIWIYQNILSSWKELHNLKLSQLIYSFIFLCWPTLSINNYKTLQPMKNCSLHLIYFYQLHNYCIIGVNNCFFISCYYSWLNPYSFSEFLIKILNFYSLTPRWILVSWSNQKYTNWFSYKDCFFFSTGEK